MPKLLKRVAAVFAGVTLAGGAAIWILGRSFAAPRYQGPQSDHFDGERFLNLEPVEEHGPGAFLKWVLHRDRGAWPDWVDAAPAAPPPERVGPGELRVTFVNHATLLIQFDGYNVLTDPIWSDRCSPVSWAGPRRHRPPGVRFDDLPPIDAIVVSHNHYDHLDVPTLRRLTERFGAPVHVALGNDAFLAREGIGPAHALDWWDSRPLGERLRIHAVPAQHFSARGIGDRDANLWAGFVLESPAGAVYFAGDTGWGPHFRLIRARFPEIRLAILPIGAFRPRWFMSPVHIAPEEAIRAHEDLGARASMVMHFGTFPLGDDGMYEAADLTRSLLDRLPEAERPPIWIPTAGESRAF